MKTQEIEIEQAERKNVKPQFQLPSSYGTRIVITSENRRKVRRACDAWIGNHKLPAPRIFLESGDTVWTNSSPDSLVVVSGEPENSAYHDEYTYEHWEAFYCCSDPRAAGDEPATTKVKNEEEADIVSAECPGKHLEATIGEEPDIDSANCPGKHFPAIIFFGDSFKNAGGEISAS